MPGFRSCNVGPRAPKIYRSSAPLRLEGPSHFKAFGPADHTMVLGLGALGSTTKGIMVLLGVPFKGAFKDLQHA